MKLLATSTAIAMACVLSTSALAQDKTLEPVVENATDINESAREAQEHFLIATAETRGIVTDIGFGWAVLVLTDEEIIPPATANKLLDETIASISKRSERFGKLAKYLNDYRINQEY